jgi:hypothetical protein
MYVTHGESPKRSVFFSWFFIARIQLFPRPGWPTRAAAVNLLLILLPPPRIARHRSAERRFI